MSYSRRLKYNERATHFKIQFRMMLPSGRCVWSKHLTLCGSEQQNIVTRKHFLKLAKDGEYVCLRCLQHANRLREDIIECHSTKELIDDVCSSFTEVYNITHLRLFCSKNDVVLHVPRVSFKTFYKFKVVRGNE